MPDTAVPFQLGQPPDPSVRMSVLEERVRGMEKALILQAAEYERRLEILNHAHAQHIEMQQTYLPRDVWNASEAGREQWRERTSEQLRNVVSKDMFAKQEDIVDQLRARTDLVAATYLSIEAFEKILTEWREWRNRIDVEMAADRGRKSVYTSLLATGVALMSLLMGIFNFVSRVSVGP